MSRKNSRAHRTTRIRFAGGETWDVPFLFGVAYSGVARDHASRPAVNVCQSIRDCLGLVGYDASIETIAAWGRQKKVEAHVYAWYEHLSASDNAVPRHPKPKWLPEPWMGHERGCGDVWAGNGPTEVRS